MTHYRIVDLPSDEPVQFVGTYVLRAAIGRPPDVAFVEVECPTEAAVQQAQARAEAAEAICNRIAERIRADPTSPLLTQVMVTLGNAEAAEAENARLLTLLERAREIVETLRHAALDERADTLLADIRAALGTPAPGAEGGQA